MRDPSKNYNKFWTGIITPGDEPDQPAGPFKGAGWEASLEEIKTPSRIERTGQEIVISASSWTSAQRALELIEGCHMLVTGYPSMFPEFLFAYNEQEPKCMTENDRKTLLRKTICTEKLPISTLIAAKASRRRKWVYSVASYKFSSSSYFILPVDLEPRKWSLRSMSPFPDEHVRFANAIITAYAVLENLGLTLRASNRKPSRINGDWNPQIKDDLERRLIQAGVDLSEKIIWFTRASRRKMESARHLPKGPKLPWSRLIIRDSEIPIIDAIAYAEWLRSGVAAHGIKNLTPTLSPYDVCSVQHVARRVLLESLGFWRRSDKKRDN